MFLRSLCRSSGASYRVVLFGSDDVTMATYHALRKCPAVDNIRAAVLPRAPILPELYKAGVQIEVVPDGPMDQWKAPEGDIAVVASFGRKIHSSVIAQFPDGGINMHPSLLPRFVHVSLVYCCLTLLVDIVEQRRFITRCCRAIA
jgi:hypothetical protein